MVNTKPDGNAKFQELPFSILVKKDKELSSIRREYASKSKSERRAAADWEYHSEIAGGIFSDAMASVGKEGLGRSYWPSGVISLAIDPKYAPAILTVGSIEKRKNRIAHQPRENCSEELFLKSVIPPLSKSILLILEKYHAIQLR